MNHIAQAKLFIYQLPFKVPLNFKGQLLTYRSGLILQLQDEQGRYGLGEIAPLAGFSRETLVEARDQIIAHLSTATHPLNKLQNGYPSVQFGLENALNYTPFSRVASCTESIPLIQGSADQVIEHYLALQKPNLIKLKVARHRVSDEVQLFNQLARLNRHLKIRCDANQAWDFQQADDFFSQIEIEQLDYIEEPTASHLHNIRLAQRHRFFLALDESLQDKDFVYQHHPAIKAFVLKPMLIGTRQRIDYFIAIAKQHHLQVSFSSSFESVLGLSQITHLADRYRGVDINLGLDTLKYFQAQQLTKSNQIVTDIETLECLWTSR
ncbi:o-succinylbenzoate synthase [Psychromonas sp. MME2]|uniref:o-succinylbenzoate synthase n=1 Tax=unclassified Psychromonas TaxID=2614957 RepID=UPI00339C66E6